MNAITLKQVLPQVFARQAVPQSDIWCTEVNFKRDQLYLVQAESGTGKSSLCSYIIGYRHDYQGEILFDNNNISRLDTADWVNVRKQHISLLFQELRLFPELTAYENVAIKNNLTHFKTKAEIMTWFDELGIADKVNQKIGRMSFGQQQRVAMMRALSQPFDFLLADEPISHLDDSNSAIMASIMMREAKAQGAGVIVTSIGKHMQLNYDKIFRL